MKKTLLKKISLFVALIGFSGAQMMAQTTIINENFSGSAYTSATDATDLNTTVGNLWISGHNANATKWQIDAAGSPANVWTGSNFTWAVHNTAITAASGEKVTITAELGFGGTAFVDAKNICIVGLTNTKVLSEIKTNIGTKRDGVILVPTSPNLVMSGSGSTYSQTTTIPQGTIAGPYEIIIEYTVGADAASTVKKVRIKNTVSGAVSAVGETTTGIQADVYTALTGPGAYFLNWVQQFYDASGLNRVKISKLNVVKNAATSLSINDFNKASIASNVSPNPVSSILNIGSDVVTKKYKVVNLAGATVLETTATGSIDVSGLANGVYLLVTDAGIAKFIKE